MKLKIDKESDTLYFRLDDSKIIDSEEVAKGIILDFNAEGKVVGFEVLDVSKRTSSEELSKLNFESV